MMSLAERCLMDLPAAVLLLADDGRTVRLCNAQAIRELGLAIDGSVDLSSNSSLDAPLDTVMSPLAFDGLQQAVRDALANVNRSATWMRLLEGRPSTWRVQVQSLGADTLVMMQASVPNPASGQAVESAATTALRELHHRLRNHLQGVAGLLGRAALSQPQAKAALDHAAFQLHLLGRVQDLLGRQGAPLPVHDLLTALGGAVPVPMEVTVEGLDLPNPTAQAAEGDAHEHMARHLLWAHLPETAAAPSATAVPTAASDALRMTACAPWLIREDDTSALALSLGEVLMACAAAQPPRTLRCRVRHAAQGAVIEIPCGIERPDAEALKDEWSTRGLGLVAALLPRRGVTLSFVRDPQASPASPGAEVCARLQIGPPCAWQAGQAAPQSAW